MKNKFIFIIVVVLIVVIGISLYFLNNQKIQQPRFENNASTDSIILKIPIIEYKVPGNLLSEPIVKSYTNKTVQKGSEFVIEPSTLGYRFSGQVGDIKLKLVEIKTNSVVIDILADKWFDKNFYPRKTAERKELLNNSCIYAIALVTDVSFEFCFNIENENGQIALKYNIQGESTMPRP